jgi:hypothetical protein
VRRSRRTPFQRPVPFPRRNLSRWRSNLVLFSGRRESVGLSRRRVDQNAATAGSARGHFGLPYSLSIDRITGEPIAVSGVVIVPDGPAPAGGRPTVAWAHPTTGIENQCAPSRAQVFFRSIQGLQDMLSRGYVVTATDYPGLGTPEIHPYLVGVSEARAVIGRYSGRSERPVPCRGAQRNLSS